MADPPDASREPKWTLPGRVLLLAILIAALALSLFPLRNYDVWHHMKFGEVVVREGRVPWAELFSFTGRDHWINPAWLAGVIFYGVHALGGIDALIVLKALMVAAAFALMLHTARREGASPTACAIAAFVLLYCMRVRLMCRPMIFSVLLLAATAWVLRGFATRRHGRLWLLPIICLFWANLHAGFFIAFALFPIFLLHELRAKTPPEDKLKRVRALIVCGACCVAATLVNPYGYHALVHPFTLTTSAHLTMTQEWQGMAPPWRFFTPGTPGFLHGFAFFWIAVALLVVSMAATWRRVTLIDALTVLLFTVMPLASRRHVDLFGVAVFPVLAKHLGMLLAMARWPSRGRAASAVHIALAVGLVAAGFGLRFGFERPGVRLGVTPGLFPIKAADFVAAHNLPGRMLNYWSWGPYLIWRFYPGRKVYADGRFEAYDEKVFDDWLVMNEGREGWRKLVDAYGINFALVAPSPRLAGQFDDPRWRLVYWDDLCVIYLRETPETKALIEQYECGLTHPAKFLAHLQDAANLPAMERQLRAKLARDPGCAVAHGNLARLLLREGRVEEATEHLERVVELQPWAPPALHDLGNCYRHLGRLDDAIRTFQRLVRMPAFRTQHGRAYLRLADCWLQKGERGRARKCYRKALRLLPGNAEAQAGVRATR